MQVIVWTMTFVISFALLYFGNKIVSDGLDTFQSEGAYTVKAMVDHLESVEQDDYAMSEDLVYTNTSQYFYAKALNGSFKGEMLLAVQTSDNYTSSNPEKTIEPGDKVILYNYGTKEGAADWVFGGYARFEPVFILLIVFCGLLILFGKTKGINTIVSLTFTVLAVFAVFVPSVLAGYNIYVMSILTCVYTIVMTLIITNGVSQKSFTTILGCTFGVLLAAILELLFDRIMQLTGVLDEHSIYLQYLSSGVEINLRALIFAMVVIGAMGAVMDVAMDISSALAEVHHHAPQLSFMELVKSGLTIGRDVMGTMANTLVLAYIGSSLCSILLLITYSTSLMELLNRESIAVEIMQSLIGSTAILLTIPLTSLVCAFLYTREKQHEMRENDNETKPALKKKGVRDNEEVYKSIIPKDPVTFYYDFDKNQKKDSD